MKQAICYVRVSTEEQAIKGYSIAEQKEIIKRYCNNNGIYDFKMIVDDGYSGKTLNRPGIRQVLQEVKSDEVDKLIIKKLDRLGRKMSDNENIMMTCITNGTDFISVEDDFNLSSAMGRFLFNFKGLLAQFESEQIGERTIDGLTQKARQGEYPHGNVVPYGFRKNKAHYLIAVNSEIEVVRKVYRYYVLENLAAPEVVRIIKKETGKSISHLNMHRFVTLSLYRGYVNTGNEKAKILCEYQEHEDKKAIDKFVKSKKKPETELKQIITDEMYEAFINRSRVRNYGKHIYKYKNMVYINGQKAKHDKKKKKSGREYWYYYIEEDGKKLYVNQNDIDAALRKHISSIEYEEFSDFDAAVIEIAKAYTRNKLSENRFFEQLEERRKNFERLTQDFSAIKIEKSNTKLNIIFV